MADDLNTNGFISEIALSVEGWNEKLELTDDQLSLMVPFCDLYAVFTGKEKIEDVGTQRLIDSGFQVKLKDFSNSPEPVILVPVFNLLDQQTSVDPSSGRLIHPRGVGGIEECTVSTFNADLGDYRVDMKIEVPSFDEDVRLNKAIRKLVLYGTDWVIGYGWARDSSQSNKPFTPIKDNTINLTTSHRGYYRFIRCMLNRFQWSINSNRIVSGNLTFTSYLKAAGLLATVKVHRGTIKELLTNDNRLFSGCPPEIRDQLPGGGGDKPIPGKMKISTKRTFFGPSGDKKVKTEKEEVGYYALGWVIEAMRQAINDPKDPWWKMTKYETWIDPKRSKVMVNADGSKEPNPLTYTIASQVPIAWKDLESEVIDLSTNESILWSIDRVCSLANKHLLDSSQLFVELSSDGKTISIRDMNDVAFYVANRADMMKIGVSTPNSLLFSIEMGSRVPIDLTWGFNSLIHTDEGATIIYNMFESEANDTKIEDKDLSETARAIRKFRKTMLGNSKTTDVNRSSNWRSFLETSDKDKVTEITNEVISNQTVPVGLALRNFFKTITVNIHGTTLVPPLTQLEVMGILPGIDGRYSVYQVSDLLTPGSFVSTLEANLLLPF